MPFSDYRITSNYGWRIHPIRKERDFHAGIDLVKAHKAPIEAFTDGEVIYAGMGESGTGVSGYGIVVAIKDKNGCAQLYCHLDSVNVKKGQHIKKGDVIGRQGATGQVTGSHLHYEVRKTSSPSLGWTRNQETSTTDPTKYLESFEHIVNKGDEALKIDGYLGPKTIASLQRYFGTPVDGVISKPSYLVRAMQIWLGIKQDGYLGPNTIRALQKRLGTPVDGVISKPSLMVMELQRRLNKGKI